MKEIRIEIRGTQPILCHNIEMSDPENIYAKEIAKISSKRKKTEEDRREIERLEWFGGLYLAENEGIEGPVIPTRMLRKSIIEAGKINRLGKHVTRALSFKDVHVPLIYDGPRDIEKLFHDKKYHNRASVSINRARIMRVRPCFPEWSLVADASLMDSIMDLDELVRLIKLAGQAEGIGDNRVNGYGRFTANIKVLEGVNQ